MATCRKHGYFEMLEGAPDCPFCLTEYVRTREGELRFSDDVKPETSAAVFGATHVKLDEPWPKPNPVTMRLTPEVFTVNFNNYKDTNPKDAVGVRKAPLSCVPVPVLMELGLAMLEGARKYGRHNYRVAGIRFSVYYDAAVRHLGAWWEGEDTDPGSGLSHITKAIATLTVLRDAMIQNMATDDRPPMSPAGWLEDFNKLAGEIIDRYPDAKEPFTKSSG